MGIAEEVGPARIETWAERSTAAGHREYRGTLMLRATVARLGGLRLSTQPRLELREITGTPYLRIGGRMQAGFDIFGAAARVHPYVAIEPSFDSRWTAITRLTLVAGTGLQLARGVDCNTFLLIQRDAHGESRWTEALGTMIRLRL